MGRREGNPKHNKYGTRFYNVWRGMVERCHYPKNKAYKHYGGKGIEVCTEWRDSATFMSWCEEQNPPLGWKIERKENSKGYCPENCHFIPEPMQHRNQSSNILVEYDGQKYILIDLVRKLGVVTETAVWNRIARGWSPYDAATTPTLRSGLGRFQKSRVKQK